ncbi:MAG TPA: RagB/SusD family nutrient uptake outer membrane protein [Gemmatimonadota bacterium]|nr:RagB/SusD family nutrient uptake outer membrane protein [Gemmatimonadota bacterium]
MKRPTLRALGMLAVVAGLVIAGVRCQDGVVDIGTIEEERLDTREALDQVVNGMGRTLSQALGHLAAIGVFVARELTWGGNQGSEAGSTFSQKEGILLPAENDPQWNAAQKARWTAEDGVRRLRQILGDEEFAESPLAAEALLYVGFANRLLGENMCQGVIDGGPPVPRSVHFERAEAAFTEVLQIADRIGDAGIAAAARAGRASVRVGLGDWPGARSDAEGVPEGFVFGARYHSTEQVQRNPIHRGNDVAVRAHTAWGSFYETYFEETGDPRVPWIREADSPTTIVGDPWYPQAKYTSPDAPIDLVSWEEMRMIVAEARLRDGDVEGAMAEIDGLRARVGLDPVPVDGLEDAWTALKRERGIELWLEGRRLGDLHRWLEAGTPGETEDMTGRDTCFPIGATERGTNPNMP